jgi:hypothetical protein
MDRPNLFDFPAGELPEAAFVAWLLSWADVRHQPADAGLHGLGTALLGRLLELGSSPLPAERPTVEVRRPYQPAATLALVGGGPALLVDEKADTRDNPARPQQLLDAVRREFPGRAVAPVLLQLEDQSSGGAARQAGFASFGRRELLEVLRQAERLGVHSDIVGDFRRHLQKVDDTTGRYRQTPLTAWGRDRDCWGGFFAALSERLGEGEWGPVTNAGGGLMAFWWHWHGDRYLQLEQNHLCFKLKVKDPALRAPRWRDWHRAVMAAGQRSELRVRRPARRRNSAWMTVATLEGDYRQAGPNGLLDLEKTVALLRQAERLQDAAAAQRPPAAEG